MSAVGHDVSLLLIRIASGLKALGFPLCEFTSDLAGETGGKEPERFIQPIDVILHVLS
jgi:hypothetical protein